MKLPAIFTDHMVLQRDKEVAIWGSATPGDRITVEFAGQLESSKAGADGKWLLKLKPMKASAQSRDLVVKSSNGDPEIKIRDCLVGDVWLASGQSNMQWGLSSSLNGEAETEAANHPGIRLFNVPNRAIATRQNDVDSSWKVCTPSDASGFSAVAYFFGRHLQKELGVPIGLINSSWGGTRIEAWMSREALMTHPTTHQEVETYEKRPMSQEARERFEEYAKNPGSWERANSVADPGDTGSPRGWASVDFDDSAWQTMKVPSRWQEFGHDYSGVFWFRREIEISADWKGKDLVLNIGACDKHDATFFNGTRVGGLGWETVNAWCTPRSYTVPAALVRPGKNVIATRVFSYMFHGGMIGPVDRMFITLNEENGPRLPLRGDWRFAVEHNLGFQTPVEPPFGHGNPHTPFILNDSMIAPLLPLSLAGAIWYQGESNAEKPGLYGELFPLMIRDWRKSFGQEKLPFFFVQLANYLPLQSEPSEGGWARIREAQTRALKEPATGMAVTIDIGDGADIHPANKQDVGKRLALAALATVFGKQIVYSGPTYFSHTVEGRTIKLKLNHLAKGLKTLDGKEIRGFAIAGEDKKFHWATAQVTIDGVTLQSPHVPRPVAVRYAWANNPVANLMNSEGLPAAPFRTDSWSE